MRTSSYKGSAKSSFKRRKNAILKRQDFVFHIFFSLEKAKEVGWRDVRLRVLGKGNDTIASGSGSAPQEDVGSIYSGRKKPQKLEFLEFPESTYG